MNNSNDNNIKTLTSNSTTLNIVAHADDDLLFLNPDLLHAIQAGHNVRTLFLIAGDSGMNKEHWQSRELGAQAAYAQMCGVANAWHQTDAGIAEHPMPVFTLADYPTVSLAFMRLPDGNIDGSGFASTNHTSLQKLWTDSISTIGTIDGSSKYSKETLISTLTDLISSFQPEQIVTQDYTGTYGDGDHSDHHSVAYFVQSAAQHYTTPHSLIGYEGYTTSSRPANVTRADLVAKQDAFYAYAHHDRVVGGIPEILPNSWRMSVRLRRIMFLLRSLRLYTSYLLKSIPYLLMNRDIPPCTDTLFYSWLRRQYIVSSCFNRDHPHLITNGYLQHTKDKR